MRDCYMLSTVSIAENKLSAQWAATRDLLLLLTELERCTEEKGFRDNVVNRVKINEYLLIYIKLN